MIVALFTIYIAIGLIAFIANLIVFTAIYRSREIASRYRIILAQISASAILALASLIAGIGRIIVILKNITTLRSRRYCLFMPWNILFVWAEPMTAVVELLVSTDRLLLILLPVAYCKRTTLFQMTQIAISHIAVGIAVIISWIGSFSQTEDKYAPVCWTNDSMLPFWQQFFAFIRMTTALLSVVLYFIAYVLTRKYISRIATVAASGSETALHAFQRRQAQLTITMSISCVFTLVLYVIPICLLYLSGRSQYSGLSDFITVLSVLTTNLNPLPNLVILYWRQADIAQAVKKLLDFRCFICSGTNISEPVSNFACVIRVPSNIPISVADKQTCPTVIPTLWKKLKRFPMMMNALVHL